MVEGTLAGYPLLDVKFTLLDGAFHAVDSSALAFEIATKAAYRQSVPKAGPQLLEPIMRVDVFTPDDNVGDVIGDLNRRRGMIKSPPWTVRFGNAFIVPKACDRGCKICRWTRRSGC